MAKTDFWPFDFTERAKGVTKFAPLTVTIARCLSRKKDGSFWGWKFEEDTTPAGEYQGQPQRGEVWSAPSNWNEATESYDPYTGPQFKKGDTVTVTLAATEKGEDIFRRVLKIALATGQEAPKAVEQDPREGYRAPEPAAKPPGAIGPSDQVPAEWTMPRSYYEARARSIERQVAAKIMGELAVSLVPVVLTGKDIAPLVGVLARAREMAEELWEPDREMPTLPSESTGADQASYDQENEDPEAGSLPFTGPKGART